MHDERKQYFFFLEFSLCKRYKFSIVTLCDSSILLLPCVFFPPFIFFKMSLFSPNRSDSKWKTLLTHIFKSWGVIWTQQSQGRWVPPLTGYPVPSSWFHCCGFSVPLWTRVSCPGFPSSWGNIAHEARREGLGTVAVRWRVGWKRRQLFMWNMWSWAESLNPSICVTHAHLIKFSWRWTRNPWVYQNDLCCVLASLERCVHVLLEIAPRLKQAWWWYRLNQTFLLNVFFKQSLLFISIRQIYLVLS